jgi:HlyD family secretion protein
LETRLKLLESARQRLRSMSEVREVDVALAEAQYQAALAEAEHAKAELGQAYIRAPMDGKVIKVHAHAGEQIGRDGVVEFAVVDPMYVVAEVHESDIARVRIGQKATVEGVALGQRMNGVVEEIGLKVGRNTLFSTDPASANDARVAEVRIKLEQAEPAARFLQARVTVVIEP